MRRAYAFSRESRKFFGEFTLLSLATLRNLLSLKKIKIEALKCRLLSMSITSDSINSELHLNFDPHCPS